MLVEPGRFPYAHKVVNVLSDIWHGINAPAFPALGILNKLGETIYLVGVALLWWTIGRAIDRRKGLLDFPTQARETVFSICALLWSLVMIAIATHEGRLSKWAFGWSFGWARVMSAVQLFAYVLQILWSVLLFTVAVIKLSRLYPIRLSSNVGRST